MCTWRLQRACIYVEIALYSLERDLAVTKRVALLRKVARTCDTSRCEHVDEHLKHQADNGWLFSVEYMLSVRCENQE